MTVNSTVIVEAQSNAVTNDSSVVPESVVAPESVVSASSEFSMSEASWKHVNTCIHSVSQPQSHNGNSIE